MPDVESMFPPSYEKSRERFRERESALARRWPQVRRETYPVGEETADLTVDVLWAPALQKADHIVVLSTGEHGIEGYVGSAMMEVFCEKLLPQLKPESTALCLVHIINPWGMKHWQRNNEHNVDLNRNFVYDWQTAPSPNLGYAHFADLLAPQGIVRNNTADCLRFVVQMLWRVLLRRQKAAFKEALLAGQYQYPQGVYYGGSESQQETRVMSEIFRRCFETARHIVHIDIHSGYGPRYQMSIVHSPLSGIASAEWKRRAGYPLVLSAAAGEFYRLEGDMLDYVYHMRAQQYPQCDLYSACFEFGCFGDSMLEEAKALWCLVANNRLRWFGAATDNASANIRRLWREAYLPSEPAWRAKAVADFEQAAACVLRLHRLI